MDYTPTADVAAAAVVVLGDLIGFAERAISANVKGALNMGLDHIELTEVPKAAEDFFQGQQVFWDEDNAQVTETQNGWLHYGYVPVAYGNAATTCNVLRLPIVDVTAENVHSSGA
jgi:predicted RecA/RadA family phage recombinase